LEHRPKFGLAWPIAAALFPLVLLGLYVLAVQIHGLVRYDPAYFGPEYTEKYGEPGAVARALETALQTGDQALMAELQGRRNPAEFEVSPSLIFIMLWDRTDRFYTYLYLDMSDLQRQVYYFEEVDSRYVAMKPDPYYYLHSGRWLVVFAPLALAWWLLEVVIVLILWVRHLSARLRDRMYGD
jgi:hypothetical protein